MSKKSIDEFIDKTIQEKRVLMVCSGPVASLSNGYYKRCMQMQKMIVPYAASFLRLEFTAWSKLSNETHEAEAGLETEVLKSYNMRLQKNITAAFTFDPIYVAYSQLQIIRGIIRRKNFIKNNDVVVIEGSLLLPVLLLAKAYRKPVVLDTHAINIDIAQKLRGSKQLIGLIRKIIWYPIELINLKLSTHIIAVADRDAELIRRIYKIGSRGIQTIPLESSIQIGSYITEIQELKKRYKLSNKKIGLFIGDLGAVHNKEAAEYLVDMAEKIRTPNGVILVVGNNPLGVRPRSDNIIFVGYVTQIEPYIAMSDVCLAPLQAGGGVKTKVLDYLALGKPVLSTTVGAEGMHANNIEVIELNDFPIRLKAIFG